MSVLAKLLRPRSIAVVGVSSIPSKTASRCGGADKMLPIGNIATVPYTIG